MELTVEFNADRLDELLSAMDDISPLPDAAAFDAQAGLQRFHERLAEREADKDTPAARRFISFTSQHPIHSRRSSGVRRRFLRISLIAAVIVLVSVSSVYAFRFHPVALFAKWSTELLHFNPETSPYAEITRNPLNLGEEREYDSIQTMVDELGITAPLFPNWVPARFGGPEIRVSYLTNGFAIFIAYDSREDSLLIHVNEVDENNLLDTQKNSEDAVCLEVNAIRHYLIADEHGEKAVWNNGMFECLIQGGVTGEEMEQIVSSIYE